MTIRTWKRFLVGATAAAALSVPSIALAGDPLCVFVLGEVNSVTVATPAIVIPVPGSSAEVQPVRVHVNEEDHSIIGYSVRTPGVDEGTDPTAVFVPGTEVTVAPIVVTTPTVEPIEEARCVHQSVSTPAVPVYVPESMINVPDAGIQVPVIELNILGNPISTRGKVIPLQGSTIVIPSFEAVVPGVTVETPPGEITIRFATGQALHDVQHLSPPQAP
jgi:hypothetical protein